MFDKRLNTHWDQAGGARNRREHGRISYCIVHVQSNEPAEQQVVIELLHQHPFAAHRVQQLQQKRTQQLLWGYRGPSGLGV